MSKHCRLCMQPAMLEKIPGTERIDLRRNQFGEAVHLRSVASFEPGQLCYYHQKMESGLCTPMDNGKKDWNWDMGKLMVSSLMMK